MKVEHEICNEKLYSFAELNIGEYVQSIASGTWYIVVDKHFNEGVVLMPLSTRRLGASIIYTGTMLSLYAEVTTFRKLKENEVLRISHGN